MEVSELKRGYSKIIIQLEEKHLNPFGGLHRGVYASIIDTAAYRAAYCEEDEDMGYTSVDVSVNNLSIINSGKLIVEGRAIESWKKYLPLRGAGCGRKQHFQ